MMMMIFDKKKKDFFRKKKKNPVMGFVRKHKMNAVSADFLIS
jgi:hypothetical protein